LVFSVMPVKNSPDLCLPVVQQQNHTNKQL
jgi:hypothetical protein